MRITEKKQKIKVLVRYMITPRDMPEILQIEQENFEFSWVEEDFTRCLDHDCKGMVAEHEGKVVGLMVFKLQRNRIHLINFAVAKVAQGFGIGKQMLEKLISILSQQHRRRIMLEVRESNVPAQLFFQNFRGKGMPGFRAIDVLHKFYDDSPEDAYLMEFRLNPPENSLDDIYGVSNPKTPK